MALQIQLWVVSVQKGCVTRARDTYPVNPVWVESTVHRDLGWMSYRLDTYVYMASRKILTPLQVLGGSLASLLNSTWRYKMEGRTTQTVRASNGINSQVPWATFHLQDSLSCILNVYLFIIHQWEWLFQWHSELYCVYSGSKDKHNYCLLEWKYTSINSVN